MPNELDDPAANAEGFPIRPDAAAALFGRLGIDRDTTVVAYDDGGSMWQPGSSSSSSTTATSGSGS